MFTMHVDNWKYHREMGGGFVVDRMGTGLVDVIKVDPTD